MSLEARGWTRCQTLLQIVLDAGCRDMDGLMSFRLSCRKLAKGSLPEGISDGAIQNLLGQIRTRIQLRQSGKIGEEDTPGLHLPLAVSTDSKMLLDRIHLSRG
jgi:hypothetical protein